MSGETSPTLKVPREPDDLSAAWLEVALHAPVGSLTTFAVEPIGGGQGIIGRLYRVSTDWKGASPDMPRSVILKLTRNTPDVLARPMYRSTFEREIRFYEEVAGTSGVRTPALHWSGIERDTGMAALLMEDLGGGLIYDSGEAPVEALEAIVRAIVPLHARWWNSPRLLQLDWLTGPELALTRVPDLRKNAGRFGDWYEKNAPGMFPLALKMPDAIERGLFSRRGPETLIHGDLGPKNAAILGDEVALFDWAVAGHRAGATDLIELVKCGFGAVPPGELSQRLLAIYHEELRKAGIADVTLEDVREEFGQASLRALMAPILLLSAPGAGPDHEANALRWAKMAAGLMEEFEFERRLREALAR